MERHLFLTNKQAKMETKTCNLVKIQSELKAPKSQFNKFAGYKYRNQEDILEAVKPLLLKYNCRLTLSDKVKTVNGVMFVKVIATFTDGEIITKVKAQAGIETQKGMSLAQCFGSSSSYARKYALNGLFLIDDTKDDDTKESLPEPKETPKTVKYSKVYLEVSEHLKKCDQNDDIKVLWDSLDEKEQLECKTLFTKRKLEIQNGINTK